MSGARAWRRTHHIARALSRHPSLTPTPVRGGQEPSKEVARVYAHRGRVPPHDMSAELHKSLETRAHERRARIAV